jgi:hypothetical protein
MINYLLFQMAICYIVVLIDGMKSIEKKEG